MEWGQRFNTTYFTNQILNDLAANVKATYPFPDKKWHRLHPNNARPHTSQDSVEHIDRHRLVRVPHRPDSPDLAQVTVISLHLSRGGLQSAMGRRKKIFSEMSPSFWTSFQKKSSFEYFSIGWGDSNKLSAQGESVSKYQSFTFGFIRFLHHLRGNSQDLRDAR
jgi:hypothetical protein